VTGYGQKGQASIPGRDKIVFFYIASRPDMGPTEPPVRWVPGTLPQGVKWLGHNANCSSLTGAEFKNDRVVLKYCINLSSWCSTEVSRGKSGIFYWIL
jgi:hypothetical protein